jgi:hypothetical protein
MAITTGGYRTINLTGHPLANADGWGYEHRAVLFNSIGWGPHTCHWCGVPVAWTRKRPNGTRYLVVDHLDEDRLHNAPANLVPSCSWCNANRAREGFLTHCRAGHAWTKENTFAGSGGKGCVKCRLQRQRTAYARKITTHVVGLDRPSAKLSRAAIAEMRAQYAAGGHSYRSLAAEYGVTRQHVGKIIRGERRPVST